MRKLLLSNLFVVQMNNITLSGGLLLREENTSRHLLLFIGPGETNSIIYGSQGTQPLRPLTHDLFISFIQESSASVDHVVINNFWNNIYYAKIVLRVGQRIIELDARPSDAIAIALRSNADIFAEESVLDKAAITEEEAHEMIQGEGEDGEAPPSSREEELEGLGPFRDFIRELGDLDSLGPDDSDNAQPT